MHTVCSFMVILFLQYSISPDNFNVDTVKNW